MITYEIYKSCDDGLDDCGVFLDISKAFDNVWYKGLINKLKQNGISGNLLDTITDFLNSRKQRVTLMGNYLYGLVLKQGYLKDEYLDHYYFQFTLMIYLMILPFNL